MKKTLLLPVLAFCFVNANAQLGFNYYKDSSRVGSPNGKAYTYFKKAYYDHIWQWTKSGADSAEHYLKLAIQEDPNYSAAYAFLAHVYQFMTYNAEDWDKKLALEKLNAEKSLSFNPRTGDGYSVMSDVLWHEKDTVQALYLLRKAIAQEPDNVGNYIWIAIRYKQMHKEPYYDSAISSLHHIIRLDPEYGQAYMKLGNVYHFDRPVPDSAKYYYRKAINVYHTIKPRDERMMDAYYWLGELFKAAKQNDSAAHYYQLFLKEMEPSNMYIRDMRLSTTYKALYECQQELASNHLHQFLAINKQRVASSLNDANFLTDILEGGYMSIEQDSVQEKYALPLARKIQAMPTATTTIKVYTMFDEFLILKKMGRPKQAMERLLYFLTKQQNEPLLLFGLGIGYVATGKYELGISSLRKASQYVNNTTLSRNDFIESLKSPDFDKIRNMASFIALSK